MPNPDTCPVCGKEPQGAFGDVAVCSSCGQQFVVQGQHTILLQWPNCSVGY